MSTSVQIIITPPTPLEAEDPFRRRPPVTPLPVVPEKLPLEPDDAEEDKARPTIDPTEKEVYVTRPDVEESEKEVYEPRTTVLYSDASEKEVYHPTQSQEIVVDEKEVYDPHEAAVRAAIDASEKEVYHFETEAHRVDTGKEVYDGSTQNSNTQMVLRPREDTNSPESPQPPPKQPQLEYPSPQSEYSQSQPNNSPTSLPTYSQPQPQPQPGNSNQSTSEPEEPQTQQPKSRFKKLHQTVVNKHKKAWETITDQSNAIINEQIARIEKAQTDVTNSIVIGATTRYARLEKGTTTRYARLEKGTTNRYNRVEQGINDQIVRAGQCVNNYAKIKDSIPGLKQKPQASPEAEKPK